MGTAEDVERSPPGAGGLRKIIHIAITLQGSYNWTRGAAANSEDLNLISSPAVAAAYAGHWRQRLAVSAPYVAREDWCRASSAAAR